jgi:anti-sigma factor RsiW
MPVLVCPATEELQRLVRGDLAAPDREALVQHLEQCASCVQTVKTLPKDDTFTELVRAARSLAGDGPEADVVNGLMQRLDGLRQLLTASAADADRERPNTDAIEEMIRCLAPPQGPDEIGRLGPYRVLKVLGSGGMGVVVEAEDVPLRRRVALKAMRPALAASTTARQRFLREGQATAALAHDHIVAIYQVGEDRGIPFLAMQLLEGETLEDRLQRQGTLPAAEVLRIGREVAAGLAAAHERGLIHRDVKPGNVWLEARDGRVKLLDFGLARTADDDTRLTQTGIILGTPQYMAPEQAAGEAVDHRCDLFSLGCALYRMATGKPPFHGANVRATLRAVETEQPQPACEVNPDVPPALSDLLTRLLAKKPADRPASAQEVVRALEAVERNPFQQRPSKRRQRLAWAGVAAGLLIALTLVAYLCLPPVREFAATVIRVATNQGELVIEADDADLEITIKQPGKEPVVEVVQKKTQRRFVLTAVDGEILAEDKESGMRVKTTDFQLSRGGRQTLSAQVLLSDKTEPGFRPLFNGKDLDGWKVVNPADTPRGAVTWSVADKALTTGEEGLQSFVHTAKAYQDYVLQLEFRFPKLVDPDLTPAAGILLHLNDPEQQDPTAYEISLGSKGRLVVWPVGGAQGGQVFGDIASLPAGKWHRLKVSCEKGKMEVFVNGKSQCSLRNYEPSKGFIALQNRGPDVQFRNLQIKELPPDVHINGAWDGGANDWGDVHLARGPDGFRGVYTATYSGEPGSIILTPAGSRTFRGRWSESAQRHGFLQAEVSSDDSTITVLWETSDPDETRPRQGESLWRRVRAAGFVPLFNGKDLDGWVAVSKKPDADVKGDWEVAGDVLLCKGRHVNKHLGYLRTHKAYENYVLELEWRLPGVLHMDTPATGVLLHVTEPDQVWPKCFKIPLWQKGRARIDPLAGAKVGALEVQGANSKVVGEWNRLTVTSQDGTVAVALNGKSISKITDAEPRRGFIALQADGTEVHFRNLRIKELPPTPVKPEADKHSGAGVDR